MTDLTIMNGDVALAASVAGTLGAPPVLFLHGLSGSRDTWDETAAPLLGRCEIWTLDFRGHGHSAWVPHYELEGYVSDAAAALEVIGRPAVVIGHSLGAVVAGVLAQRPHPLVRAVLLEDPPWFLGAPGEMAKTRIPEGFAALGKAREELRSRNAPLRDYASLFAALPSGRGGLSRDHTSERHLLSRASALQRMDPACLGLSASSLTAIDTDVPLNRPAKVLEGEGRCGAVMLEGHAERWRAISPGIEIVRYDGADHQLHRSKVDEARFIADVVAFVSRHAGS